MIVVAPRLAGAASSRAATPVVPRPAQAAAPAGDRHVASADPVEAALAHLARVRVPAGAPYTAADLVAQVRRHLADAEVIDQGDRNTCAATTVQYMLLKADPAEYVRLVAGLAGEGRVTLRSGATMTAIADAVPRDDSGRDDVERIVQAAFQNHGRDVRGEYSSADDATRHGNRKRGGLGGLFDRTIGRAIDWGMGKLGAEVGIAEGKAAALYADVTGKPTRLLGNLPGDLLLKPRFMRGDVYGEVAAAVQGGKAVPADIVTRDLADRPGAQAEHVLDVGSIGYAEQQASHQILVTRIADGKVHYRNPWGYQTWMTEREFRSRLTDAYIPA